MDVDRVRLTQCITNLLNNCLTAFEKSTRDARKILLLTEVIDVTFVLTVADNGPGIEGISLRDIWLPGETTQSNGTGLGLAIVHDAVVDLGGRVRALAHGRLGGAELTIELPLLGK